MSHRVTIEPFGEAIEVQDGETILSAVLRAGRYVSHGCKHGGCGTCRAMLVEGDCELSDQTSFSLSDADREAGIVLLCSTTVADDEAVIDVADTMSLTIEEFEAGQHLVEHIAEVEAIEPLAVDLVRLRMALVEPARMTFVAGQYVEVEVPGGEEEWRSFSLANSPSQSGFVELIIKILPGGRFSTTLASGLASGDLLRVRGPLGRFAVQLSHRPMVMIAGGSGIAPVLAMITDLIEQGNSRQVSFYYGARTDADIPLLSELTALAAAHPWLEFVPALSEPHRNVGPWSGETGLVTDIVARRQPALRGHEAYLCGPPPMIDAAIPLLVAAGVKERHVHFDRFVPSG